ncbi:MAG TPA: hypothetical protein DCL54_08725 [Alphaproteobacteria bacterium]|nr:hypothetical protein [Alphaproteobacteria bacterium]
MAARAESKLLQRPGVTIEALVEGQGPLIVMIPSLGRLAEDFNDLSARLIAEGFRTARVQPRGIGDSTGPMDGQTVFSLADDTAAVIEGLGGKAIIIGHAFGQRQARARPELVIAVVAIAAGGKGPIPDGCGRPCSIAST